MVTVRLSATASALEDPVWVEEAEKPASGLRLELERVAAPGKELVRAPGKCDLWAYVWTASGIATDLLLSLPVRGRRVLELGAGLAIPSLAAACVGAKAAVATDLMEDALRLVRANASRNGVSSVVSTARLDWMFEARALEAGGGGGRALWADEGGFDIVVGAEVIFLASMVRPIVRVLADALRVPQAEGGDGRVALVVHPDRAAAEGFPDACTDAGLACWTYAAKNVRAASGVLKLCVVHVVWAPTDAEIAARPAAPAGFDKYGPHGDGFLPLPRQEGGAFLAHCAALALLRGLRARSAPDATEFRIRIDA